MSLEKVKELIKAVQKEDTTSAKDVLKEIVKTKYMDRKEQIKKTIGSL